MRNIQPGARASRGTQPGSMNVLSDARGSFSTSPLRIMSFLLFLVSTDSERDSVTEIRGSQMITFVHWMMSSWVLLLNAPGVLWKTEMSLS